MKLPFSAVPIARLLALVGFGVVATPVTFSVGSPGGFPATYQLVPDQSVVRIEVGKAGLLGFAAGHTHEVEGPLHGTISADPNDLANGSVRVEIRTADLRVTGRGEPAGDVPKVQARMRGPEVLDVARYPEITFRSTSIVLGAQRASEVDLRATGELTLRGQTKLVTVPVRLRLGVRSLTASGTLSVKQTDFGIKPVSVGGVVSVKDLLTVHFTMTGALQTGGTAPPQPPRPR